MSTLSIFFILPTRLTKAKLKSFTPPLLGFFPSYTILYSVLAQNSKFAVKNCELGVKG